MPSYDCKVNQSYDNLMTNPKMFYCIVYYYYNNYYYSVVVVVVVVEHVSLATRQR